MHDFFGIFKSHAKSVKKVPKSIDFGTFFGGDKRDRTADLLNAIQALSQLVRLHAPPKPGQISASIRGRPICVEGQRYTCCHAK